MGSRGGSAGMQAAVSDLGVPCCLQEQRAHCLCLSSPGKWAVPLKYLHASVSSLFPTATGSEDFCHAVQGGGACPGDQQRVQQADAHASPSKHQGNCMPCVRDISIRLRFAASLGVNWMSRGSHRYRQSRNTHTMITTSEHGNFVSLGYN